MILDNKTMLIKEPVFHDNGEITLSTRIRKFGGLLEFDHVWRGGLGTWRSNDDGRTAPSKVADMLARFHVLIHAKIENHGIDETVSAIAKDAATIKVLEQTMKKHPWNQFVRKLSYATICLIVIALIVYMVTDII